MVVASKSLRVSRKYCNNSGFRQRAKTHLTKTRLYNHRSQKRNCTTESTNKTETSTQLLWKDLKDQRQFFDWLATDLSIHTFDDWYSIKTPDVKARGGTAFILRYGSISKTLKEIYPQVHWQPWRFQFHVATVQWTDLDVQREVIEWIGESVGAYEHEDWYFVSAQDIKDKNFNMILSNYYEGSLYRMLSTLYPDYEWKEWMFIHTTGAFWENLDNQRNLFNWVFQALELKELDDWYKVTHNQITNLIGDYIIASLYGGSYTRALTVLYPELKPWGFGYVSGEFWHNINNQREFINWLGQQLQIKELDDWYKVTEQTIRQHGGNGFLLYHQNSFANAMNYLFPDHPWYTWKFADVPADYWTHVKNQREMIQIIGKELGVQSFEDWYKVTPEELREKGARHILTRYGNVMVRMFNALYPEVSWEGWRFVSNVPSRVLQNHKRLFEHLAQKHGIKELDDWYEMKATVVRGSFKRMLEQYYGGSMIKALSTLYPDHKWLVWKFSQVPRGFWDNIDNIREYVEWLSQQLGISKLEDWYNITLDDIKRFGGSALLGKTSGLGPLLTLVHPGFVWEGAKRVNLKGQAHFSRTLHSIFPTHKIECDYRGPTHVFSDTQWRMELDFYIPELSLAFEYQGTHHYQYHWTYGISPRTKEEQKRQLCKRLGITLIEIPYWWDRSKDSLCATIHQYRSDIALPSYKGTPIPEYDAKDFSAQELQQYLLGDELKVNFASNWNQIETL